MPLYEYKCEGCGEVFEKIEKFADEPLKVHDKCGGPVHRLMSAPAFQFKGTGWYVTDYAKGGATGSPKGESDKSDGSKDSGKSDGGKSDGGKGDGGKGDSGTSDSSSKNDSSNKKESSSKGAPSDKGSSNTSTKTESKPAAGSEKS